MKIFSIILMLIFTVNTIAVAPYGLNGQNQSTTYPNVHQVPNKQVTNLGGINALIETGNNNLLENPSFEHATVQSGWTNSAGTIAAESSIVVHGKKSLKITLSSQALDIFQNSTLYQTQFADGVQGLASIKIKTAISGLRVCAQKAGAVNSNLCVSVNSDNKWGYYKVPFILGGTSNGIEIDSNGVAVTGDVYFDEAFVGAQELTQQINACDSADCTTVFAASISSAAGVSYENVDWINSCTLTGTSTYTCTYNTNLASLPMSCVASINGTATDSTVVMSSTATNFIATTKTAGTDTARNFMVICERQGSDYTSALYKGVGNTYSSNNADTDWKDCQFSTLAWQGLGTISSENLICKRTGANLEILGWVTIGTVSASEARIPLPLWNGVQLNTKNSSIISGAVYNYVGSLIRSTTSASTVKFLSTIIGPSLPYINISLIDTAGTTNPTVPQNGSVLFTNNSTFEINASIPIEGWENSNLIIGQFNGLESCTNTLECTDTFSAKIDSAGVVYNENANWINGNCSYTSGVATCTFNSGIFTTAPSCTATSLSNRWMKVSPGSSSITTTAYIDAATISANVTFDLICQKQGVDYIGKTAKAVASDQNLRTPGVTDVKVCAILGTTGTTTVSVNKGSCVSGATTSGTGLQTVNFVSGFFKSNPICTCSVSSLSVGRICSLSATSSSSSIATSRSDSNIFVDHTYHMTCIGE